MEGRLDLLMREACEQHAHHAQVDPDLTGGGQEFIVLAQAPVAPDPRNRALDNPAVWLGLEAG